MAKSFQAAYLIASPSYPNSIAWSEENLVAVASGHIITILNPAFLDGPRGIITLRPSKPFQIGVVEREDLLTPCLLPICLSHETRPCARSISWSHAGLALNSGCLLAVCTSEGRVKLYRPPFCEFSAEWVEVIDLSDMLYDYFVSISFGESAVLSTDTFHAQMVEDYSIESGRANDLQHSVSSKRHKRRTKTSSRITDETGILRGQLPYFSNGDISHQYANGGGTATNDIVVSVFTEVANIPFSSFKQGSSVEVLRQDGSQRIWTRGMIERMEAGKALVNFPEATADGERDEWIEMSMVSHAVEVSGILNAEVDDGSPLGNIRPYMDLGILPSQILLVGHHRVEKVVHIGQAVEAWLNNRWVEGAFMGSNSRSLLVKISDGCGCISLDPTAVRLAPVWNGATKSWQVTTVKIQMESVEKFGVTDIESGNFIKSNQHWKDSVSKFEEKTLKRSRENVSSLITARQFASHNAMLTSLVVSWSPPLQSLSEDIPVLRTNFSSCTILAVGGKSGKISLWRVHQPRCYSIELGEASLDTVLIGLLQAHGAWITAIGWSLYVVGSSSQLILATGSSDGSVKIWGGDARALIKSSGVNNNLHLLKEVIAAPAAPVSALSLTMPVSLLDEVYLAIGNGSGSLEVWIYNASRRELQNVGSYDAHDQGVTGIAWGFGGRCLYSCSQDNSMRSWILCGTGLHEVPFPSCSPDHPSCSPDHGGSKDHSNVFDLCFGLALSPANLIVGVVRSCDVELLDRMYEAKIQKAAVEFFWTGGLQLGFPSDKDSSFNMESFPHFSKSDLACWVSNILWSLNSFDHAGGPLILWDVIAALVAFKKSLSNYVDFIMFKWLASWFLDCHPGLSSEKILSQAPSSFSKAHSHCMHLLNVICRRVMLAEVNADILDSQYTRLRINDVECDRQKLWIELLMCSERELRQRLVSFSFATVLHHAHFLESNVHSVRSWLPTGVAQMEQWVAVNCESLQEQVKFLGSEVGKLVKRLHSTCVYVPEEQCSFCSASVPFWSPEVAFCKGVGESHKQARCSVSMRACPSTPLWFCKCCQRWASKLAPGTFFVMSESLLDLKSLSEPSILHEYQKPLCPFCGILLQRQLPDFLLSASPV